MRRIYEAVIIFVATALWWGFIYPELSMVPETCAQEAEADTQKTGNSAQEAEADMQKTGNSAQEAEADMQKTGNSAQEAETDMQKVEDSARKAEADTQKTGDGAQEAETSKRMADTSSEIGKKLGSTGIRSGNYCIKSRIAEYLYQKKMTE
ncbi:MAG: hypothetical protein NC429_01840 [Lachnospiraceae bacterium]|nr:hypothetical protein [Lachnospiraceae bacterium]